MTVPNSNLAHQTDTTVYPTLFAVALAHLLNDVMQSLIPAGYPLLKENLQLSFTQIGLITFVFQGTASLLQPLIGFWGDKRAMPFAMSFGMGSTGLGLILLAQAQSFGIVLCAVALIGLGSAIFHPEASRIVRLSAGSRPGFAQSVFQVGGNAGSALGPLAAAFIVLDRGQVSIEWFAFVALLGMVLLIFVGRWYQQTGLARAANRRAKALADAPPARVARFGMAILLLLIFSKFVYTVSYSSFFTFYLIERFDISKTAANLCLFVFLASVAAGTILGGAIGDRIGRRRVILWSILGILPLTVLVPLLPLVPTVIAASVAGLVLASAFPAMVVFAQDLMPHHTGMVGGMLFGFAFGVAAIGAAVLGMLADHAGIVAVFRLCSFLPAIGLIAFWLPDLRH
jgi:MFS transporter, FSR family, fosmidomycin resistance protein